jgi:hypothetical protein
MLPVDPQRLAELPRRLAARALCEEDFQILPDLLAWIRQLGQLLSEEDLTEERLQAWLLDSAQAEEQAAPAEKTNRRGPRAGRSGHRVAERRSGNRRA